MSDSYGTAYRSSQLPTLSHSGSSVSPNDFHLLTTKTQMFPCSRSDRRTFIALSIFSLLIECIIGTSIVATISIGIACTSKFFAPWSSVNVNSCATLTGPGGSEGGIAGR